MSANGLKRVVIVSCLLLGWSLSAAAQGLTVDGDVTATSFAGDGGGLTGVPGDLHHAFFEISCAAGATCSVFKDCPANFEVTGGGFFIESTDAAARKLVTLHQSYRATTTQWLSEATNGSAGALDFFTTVDCARVAPGMAPDAPPSSNGPRGFDLSRVLLACPEWDMAKFVEPQDASASHFCPNHGLVLTRAGGGPTPTPLAPSSEVPER